MNIIETHRKTAKVMYNYGHINLNILSRGFGISADEIIDEIENAIRKTGKFYPHEAGYDKFYCIYTNKLNEIVVLPCSFKKKGKQATITVKSIFRKNKGWLDLLASRDKFK